ncbi:hypothetical protein H696_01845 [Fonticula alba]|uniref:Uncharacterized protein n=1 Tax=Fonticula alba TaxID=691883 RepID=A0A058ZAA9_FONAL|nr:hypothetical protein H696_01845 [Fonticula alba]KCV70898.1 hypothetical protein H696_01845 [Fonticula alba]|eukprot:XP_009494021.1 hypothetical protein H696_01845 [Fonticula alba]
MDSNIPLEELLADTKDLFVTETEVERSRELARQEWERRREANPDIDQDLQGVSASRAWVRHNRDGSDR